MSEPLIVLTDPPPPIVDTRCPKCNATYELRKRSETFGPVHDVCGSCGHNFKELTVPEVEIEEGNVAF